MVSILLPSHKYFGPGNNLACGDPYDSDDAIAQEHDQDYAKATCKEDVYAADKKAISAFTVDWVRHRNWHSVTGAFCLGFKHFIERLINKVLYPRIQYREKSSRFYLIYLM